VTRVACERMGVSEAHAAGFRGEGQTIAVCDTGLDLGDPENPHPALAHLSVEASSYRRGGRWDDPHGHGTHVLGSIFGVGVGADGDWCGSAPGAALFLQSVYGTQANPFECRPPRITELLQAAYDRGARIHSNSWDEASSRGVYSRTAREIDAFVADHPDLLVVVAAGNSGAFAAPDAEPTPSTIRSPAPAKNALAVGATKNHRPEHSRPYRSYYDRRIVRSIPVSVLEEGWSLGPDGVTPFSGRGPTRDGRIKPDVVAPGTAVISARSRHGSTIFPTAWGDLDDPNLALMGGTSVATPLVAGAAAVARQYLIEVGGVPSPSAALLRAVLVNGAAPLHGALVPNPNQGWGRIDLRTALGLGSEAPVRTFEDEVRLGARFRLVLPSAREAGELRVTLAWTDPPGEQLISDLDLVVRVGGEEWHGNQPPGGRGFDRTNNLERVISPLPVGEVEIEVVGERLDVEAQAFALAVTGVGEARAVNGRRAAGPDDSTPPDPGPPDPLRPE